ncbi:hypothetical protein EVAR_33778_1 [Eumeta japonica]|uniref:Uncharacterized protein n=1 Tax=Eumeta variegata TaxID=151549 RepID=A0A4C1VVP5_EUMVA|nr:hypothetical protein EVAR_33778_1 [Eumeta japonica]
MLGSGEAARAFASGEARLNRPRICLARLPREVARSPRSGSALSCAAASHVIQTEAASRGKRPRLIAAYPPSAQARAAASRAKCLGWCGRASACLGRAFARPSTARPRAICCR